MPKAAKVSLVVVAILAGLVIGADRALAYVAGRTIADKVAEQLESRGMTASTKPSVSVNGFPFLTQVLAGEYSSIEIHSDDLTTQAGSGAVRLTNVDVRAEGVQTENRVTPVLAQQVFADGTVSYDSIADLLTSMAGGLVSHATLSPQSNQLKIDAPVSFLGQSIDVVVLTTPSINNGRLSLTIDEIGTKEGGQLPPQVRTLLSPVNTLLANGFALPDLPYDLQVDQVQVTDSGLRVSARAADVPLR